MVRVSMQTILQSARQLYLGLLRKPLPEYERSLLQNLKSSKAKLIGLYGSRGVGKTTLMLQWLKQQAYQSSEMLYISCDHAVFSSVNLFELVAYFEQQGGKIIVIDEIHQAKGFEQSLKSIYDFLQIKVVFSGSSAISLTSPDFSRRYSMFNLSQLSFREYVEMQTGLKLDNYSLYQILNGAMDISYQVVSSLKNYKVLPLFQDYLKHGGYPFYFEDPLSFPQRLNDTINLVLQLELSQLFQIQPDKVDLLKKLLMVISRSKPFELSIEKITTNVELSKPTLYKFLDYLQRGELVRQVPHEQKKFKTIRKADKLYLFHPNLLSVLSVQAEIGTLRETFFACQLAAAGHVVEFAQLGDFVIDESLVFEVGGKSKDFTQLKQVDKPAYLALDDIEYGSEKTIPLWLFGFLY